MNNDDEKRVLGAMGRIRETEKKLTEIQDGTVEPSKKRLDPGQEAELWDNLLTLQMGIGPIRRKMATGDDSPGEPT